MKLKVVFTGIYVVFLGVVASASSVSTDLVSCNSFWNSYWNPNPHEGQKCATTNGSIFELSSEFNNLGGAWKDSDGINWASHTHPTTGNPDSLTQKEAKDSCLRAGGRLPSKR